MFRFHHHLYQLWWNLEWFQEYLHSLPYRCMDIIQTSGHQPSKRICIELKKNALVLTCRSIEKMMLTLKYYHFVIAQRHSIWFDAQYHLISWRYNPLHYKYASVCHRVVSLYRQIRWHLFALNSPRIWKYCLKAFPQSCFHLDQLWSLMFQYHLA